MTLLTAERRSITSGGQIDTLYRDWLNENYVEEITSEYTTYSLMIPAGTDLYDAREEIYALPLVPSSPSEPVTTLKLKESRDCPTRGFMHRKCREL